jgi:hypothetical protein
MFKQKRGFCPPAFALGALVVSISTGLATPGDTVSSYASPGSSPQGLAWDGTYLWLADAQGCKEGRTKLSN